MRLTLLFLISALLAVFPQADVWQNVNLEPDPQPNRVTVSKAQFATIKKTLTAGKGTLGAWPCDVTDEGDWTQALIFEDLPVSSTEKVLLMEAGPGCARGGQGANGAMWVVRFKGDKPVLLATPQQKFNGWLYSIQPTVSHGLRDLVLGWHMGASETGLSYFRFDGAFYRPIGAAILTGDADGNAKIVPQKGN
jgi:hypothetical protein